jgi:hypothetical protein
LISLRHQSLQLNSNFRGSRLRPTRLSKIFAANRRSRRKPSQPQASKPSDRTPPRSKLGSGDGCDRKPQKSLRASGGKLPPDAHSRIKPLA